MSRLSAIDADEVAARLTAFANSTIMARGRSIAPDDMFEAAGVDGAEKGRHIRAQGRAGGVLRITHQVERAAQFHAVLVVLASA